jgi:Tfp pilus assembly protein PilF
MQNGRAKVPGLLFIGGNLMREAATKSKTATVPVQPRFPAWLGLWSMAHRLSGAVRIVTPQARLAALLVLATVALYWPATHHDFINFDDPDYVTANVHVQNGLTLGNIQWAFSHLVSSNWHPVTMLSHMLDCQLFGLKPGAHHLVSVLFHAANTVLLFALLRSLTGAVWRSALVAALFALHPLHVESVAWISERKDVLSAFFGLLCLMAYAQYVGKSRVHSPQSKGFYFLALLFFALGLMSKAMLVTWPFVMLLLDWWPLRRIYDLRFTIYNLKPLLIEKIPFFALAAAASVVTYVAQKQGGAVVAMENLPLGERAGNALVSYCRYLGKLFWPVDLAVFYPHPIHWPVAEVVLAGVFLAGISALVFLQRRRQPFLLMGWLWFVGTLMPVIGLVQAGEQAMADRYTYIPSVGIFILTIWGAHELARGWRHHAMGLSAAGTATLVLCVVLTRQQLGYWQDSETLFRHALKVTRNNYIALDNYGNALFDKGRPGEAIREFREALRLKPDDANAHYNLGAALGAIGQIDEAIPQFQPAIRLKPGDAWDYYDLGVALAKKGQTDEAIRQFQTALRLKPDDPKVHFNLGDALVKKGQTGEAISQYREAIRLKPDYAIAHYNLGNALDNKGRTDEAIREFQEAVRLKPNDADTHNALGAAFDEKGRVDEAIRQFQEAIRLKPDDAMAHNNLGSVFLNEGRTNEAIGQFQDAIRFKPDYANANNNLGYLWARRGENLDQARALIEKAVQLEPKNAAFLDSMGWVLLKLNRPGEGLDYLLKAIENSSRPDALLYDHLGDIYAALNQLDNAAVAWRKSLSLEPNPQVQKKLGAVSAP